MSKLTKDTLFFTAMTVACMIIDYYKDSDMKIVTLVFFSLAVIASFLDSAVTELKRK